MASGLQTSGKVRVAKAPGATERPRSTPEGAAVGQRWDSWTLGPLIEHVSHMSVDYDDL